MGSAFLEPVCFGLAGSSWERTPSGQWSETEEPITKPGETGQGLDKPCGLARMRVLESNTLASCSPNEKKGTMVLTHGRAPQK